MEQHELNKLIKEAVKIHQENQYRFVKKAADDDINYVQLAVQELYNGRVYTKEQLEIKFKDSNID